MIIGTAGHIDHGKTSLVRALTGVDTDRLPEEKRRGITIDLGFAPLELPGVGIAGIVDVPGHEAFVRTMLAGASGVDVALLVVAADEGVMPQTREHVAILELLGVRRGVVAITKADVVDDAWCQLVARDISLLLADTALNGTQIIPVSAVTGQGLDALRGALASAARGAAVQSRDDLARLPVDRVFTKAGTGTVVTGTLWSGTLRTGEDVSLLPSGQHARIRGLQIHGASVDHADAGTRVAVALAGIDRAAVSRGEVLVTDGAWEPSLTMRADVTLLLHAAPLSARSRVRFHLGTREVGARVVCIGGPQRAGDVRPARIVLDAPVVARGGDRFVLRRPSPQGTIGGGVVTDAIAGRRRTRPFDAVGLPVADRFARVANEGGIGGVNAQTVAMRVGVLRRDSDALRESAGGLVAVGTHIVPRSAIDAASRTVLKAVDAHHMEHPRDTGAPLELARALCKASPSVTQFILDGLIHEGSVVVEGPTIRRASWHPFVDSAGDQRKSNLLARLNADGAAAPTTRDLERDTGFPVVPFLRQLERDRLVVALNAERFASASVVQALRENIAATLSPDKVYTPSELRSVFGVSRQYLIPWLEYFDRTGFTQRDGDGRRFRIPKDRSTSPSK